MHLIHKYNVENNITVDYEIKFQVMGFVQKNGSKTIEMKYLLIF